MESNENNQIIITVTGKDKVVIVSAISNSLAEHKVNIEDIKQTIMQDNFVMIMLCNIEKMEVSFKEFKDNILKLSTELGMEIWVQKKEIFDKMHTI